MTNKLNECYPEVFWKYVEQHDLEQKPGYKTHSYHFVDKNNNILATMLTSSYSNTIEYKINKETNYETYEFLNNKINTLI